MFSGCPSVCAPRKFVNMILHKPLRWEIFTKFSMLLYLWMKLITIWGQRSRSWPWPHTVKNAAEWASRRRVEFLVLFALWRFQCCRRSTPASKMPFELLRFQDVINWGCRTKRRVSNDGTRHKVGEARSQKCFLAPTVKHTGQESGGELCEIFKFWSFMQSKSVNYVSKLHQLLRDFPGNSPQNENFCRRHCELPF